MINIFDKLNAAYGDQTLADSDQIKDKKFGKKQDVLNKEILDPDDPNSLKSKVDSFNGIVLDPDNVVSTDKSDIEVGSSKIPTGNAVAGALSDAMLKAGVFDISAYNLTNDQPTPYADLEAALGNNGENVPEAVRKGGMQVKFIQGSVGSSDNKYVQYWYVGIVVDGNPNPFLDIRNWEKVVNSDELGRTNLPIEEFGYSIDDGDVAIGEAIPERRTATSWLGYTLMPASAGDVVRATGTNGHSVLLWAWLDNENRVLARSQRDTTETGEINVAPSNTAYLLAQFKDATTVIEYSSVDSVDAKFVHVDESLSTKATEQEIDILNSDITALNSEITAVNSLIVGKISLTSFNTLNLFIDGSHHYNKNANARCVVIGADYLVGQKLTIEYPSAAATKSFAFLKSLDGIDTDGSTPDFCTGTARFNQGTYTVPNDCKYLLLNLSGSSSLSIYYPIVTVNGSVDERLNDLENFVYEAIDVTESPLYDIVIGSGRKWESDGIRKSILLDVSSYRGRYVRVEYDSTFSAGFIAFLKNNAIGEAGDNVSNFCDGYNQRYTSGFFRIPVDCNDILMQVVSAAGITDYPSVSLYNARYNEPIDLKETTNRLIIPIDWYETSLTGNIIGSSLKWENNNVSKGAIIDASDYKGKYIDIRYDSAFSAPFVVFLKSTTGEIGDTVDYCDGCDERYRSGLYKVPNDCNYIFFYITNVSNLSCYPKVSIYGEIFTELTKKDIPDAWTINPLHLKFDTMIDHDAYPGTEINALSGKKMEYLYNHYDALMAAYPQYITKINLDDLSGINEDADTSKHAPYDVTEYPCYAYKFTPNYNYSIVGGQQAAKLPRIMCATGRGADSTNIISAMRMMEDICGHWREHEGLEQLRFGCEIIFVPCVSPWEMAHNTGRNINGVNLNRNFDTGPYSPWQYEVDPNTGLAVSGPYADSEYETRLMEFTLMYFKPDCFFSFQTTEITNDYPIVGGSVLYCSDDNYRRVLLNVASEITRKELKKYAEDFTVPGETHLNISDDQLLMFPHKYESNQYGRMTLWAYLHLGIELCGSLDISDGFLWHDGVVNTTDPTADYGNAKGMTIQTHVDTIVMLRALQRLLLKV